MIVGSNTFNLAAMIGVSALLVGCVQVARNTLLLEGSVALAVTVIVIALLVGWISAVPAVLAIACVVGVYLLLVLGGEQLADRLGLSRLAALVKDRDSRWALVTYGWPERRDVVIAGGHVVGQEAVALCSSRARGEDGGRCFGARRAGSHVGVYRHARAVADEPCPKAASNSLTLATSSEGRHWPPSRRSGGCWLVT